MNLDSIKIELQDLLEEIRNILEKILVASMTITDNLIKGLVQISETILNLSSIFTYITGASKKAIELLQNINELLCDKLKEIIEKKKAQERKVTVKLIEQYITHYYQWKLLEKGLVKPCYFFCILSKNKTKQSKINNINAYMKRIRLSFIQILNAAQKLESFPLIAIQVILLSDSSSFKPS